MKLFQNKVILVTGGSSGLGAATAVLLAERGARLVIAARRRDKGEAVQKQIEKNGGTAMFVEADEPCTGSSCASASCFCR